VANHRADSRAVTRLPGIGLLPPLIGVAVLVLAALGAITGAASSQAKPSSRTAPQPRTADALTTVAASGALDRRERAVSRGSRRTAGPVAGLAGGQVLSDRAVERHQVALAALAANAERRARRIAEDRAKRIAEARARRIAEARAKRIAEHTWHLPVTRGAYHLTSGFGACSSLWSHCHTGLDFAAPDGTPIHAVAAGTVTEVGYAGAYGNRTVIRLPDGTELWYCHQSAYAVKDGRQVVAGQVIGSVGSTGNTTGPHVHLEVRPSKDHPVDPFQALVTHGVRP
jgi:murein DD-endopeptidase MepM/ murein hydrolase activator NlpD